MHWDRVWNTGDTIISIKPSYDLAVLTVYLSHKYDIVNPSFFSWSPLLF